MKRIWPFSFYFIYFAAFASLLPFLVLFYQQLGFSGAQIGLLTGVPPLITLGGAPFLTRLADATQKHKLIMGVGLTGALIVALILPLLQSFVLVFLLVIAFNIFMSSLTPLADSAIMTMLGAERSMYGRVRLGGTIGWGLFAPIAGWMIDTYGLKTGFWAFAAIMLINLYVTQKFTFGKPHEGGSNSNGIRALLTNRHWILFLLTAFLGGLGSMSAAAYLFPYMAELGATETMMGIAITISTLTELPIFFFGHHLVRRFTSRGLLLIALLLLGIRSLLYALVNTTPLVFLVQALGGTLFPALWLAGVSYADENAPPGLKSTVQGVFAAMTFGFGSAIGGILGGPLLESLGGRGMYMVFGIIILVGLALIEGIRRILPDEKIPQPVS